jgi:hypothetical protein
LFSIRLYKASKTLGRSLQEDRGGKAALGRRHSGKNWKMEKMERSVIRKLRPDTRKRKKEGEEVPGLCHGAEAPRCDIYFSLGSCRTIFYNRDI